jgi:TonB family protein
MTYLRTFAVTLSLSLLAAPLAGQRMSTACTTRLPAAADSVAEPTIEDGLRDAIRGELFGGAREAAVAAGVAEPRGLLVVELERRSGRVTHRLLGGNVPDAVLEPFVVRLAPRLRNHPSTEEPLVLFGRLEPDAPLAETLLAEAAGPIEACVPELRDPAGFARRLTMEVARRIPHGGEPTRVALELVVSRDGEVAHARLREPSGFPALDRAIVERLAPGMRFTPGTIGGGAVDMPIVLPLPIVPRDPSSQGRRPR